jgi:hypothetical protein
MTADLQARRDACAPGDSVALASKGVSFGTLSRDAGGAWITSGVEGLVGPSLATSGPSSPPSLIVRPFHQASNVVSLRQFSNNAFNHHHGIQAEERFGVGVDADGDGFVDEATRADITASSVYQATLAVPGRVIPRDPEIEAAVLVGEQKFVQIGCGGCHVPALPLTGNGNVFVEPNPFNPAGNLRPEDVPEPFAFDLTRAGPTPRLPREIDGSVLVPAFTDLKRHDMGPLLDTEKRVQAGVPTNQWLTKKLWGFASEPHFLHHGRATLISEAILAHGGDGQAARDAFAALPQAHQREIVAFLKTLQILPVGETSLTVVR